MHGLDRPVERLRGRDWTLWSERGWGEEATLDFDDETVQAYHKPVGVD